MKKWLVVSFSIILSFCLLFTLADTVSANKIVNSEVDPTVTPITGVTNFVVTLLPILNLPGQTTTASGQIVPVGYASGEKQFEGKGVQVSGLTYGSAKACFPITAIHQGWGGKVGRWDGSKWELLDTTISTPAESSYSLACATINGNGTYALIKWVDDPSKLPTNKPDCNFDIEGISLIDIIDGYPIEGTTKVAVLFSNFLIYSKTDLENKSVSISLVNVEPSGSGSLLGNPNGTLSFNTDFSVGYSLTNTSTYTLILDEATIEKASFKLDFGSCKLILPLPIKLYS